MIKTSWLVPGTILLSEVTELWTYEDVEVFSHELRQRVEEAGSLDYHVVNIQVNDFPLTTNFSHLVSYFKGIPHHALGELLLIVPHPTMRLILTSVAYILRWKHSLYDSVEEAYRYVEQRTDHKLERIRQ